ncbi:uncharacterized protein A4U43_C03F12530 [Asparagus officinalis]|uniref:C2H2-type domain-containing protein n=1 Tax=Asparagus officinalis TaxID=4686 RepID=A0A5P1FBA0_ASPOF|nr:protein indeterminate-domain 14-like [Asparagus officinalis]ONK75023.1 uncharacterized protein A4U43_C03F12530 [Asparagus officinalis]
MSALDHSFPPSEPLKKKRRPAGTPDPDAEVVSLSPKTLLESGRYVCDICNQGFQRDQNLQMHRRRHKVPWKLLKREPVGEVKKRVFVCPEPSCLHHDPSHALGDLVGIKKHYRRKHSDRRQWVCDKCGKGYAVQSDFKAHVKTCGTRGHTCDCGKVFSRVESFIEHQDTCNTNQRQLQPQPQIPHQSLSLSQTTTSPSPSPSTDTAWSSLLRPNFELQLLPPSPPQPTTTTNSNSTSSDDETQIAHLNLSLGPTSPAVEKAEADEARLHARRQVELAEMELMNAKRIRQQAQAELDKAFVLRDHAAKSINSLLLQITCQNCKLKLWPKEMIPVDENSVAGSLVIEGNMPN